MYKVTQPSFSEGFFFIFSIFFLKLILMNIVANVFFFISIILLYYAKIYDYGPHYYR